MSKSNQPKKKVVVKTETAGPAKPQTRSAATSAPSRELTFNQSSYLWMGIGAVVIAVGLALMSGGAMPSPEVWDPNLIYSNVRITLAPIIILVGLGIEVYAIFWK